MKKIYLIIIAIGAITDSFSQINYTERHVYGITSDFYYLDVSPQKKYRLKVGMYSEDYIKGNYEINKDTLKLISFDFHKYNEKFSDYDKLVIKKVFSKFLVLDSILIPTSYRNSRFNSLPISRDSTIISDYIQNDGHAYFRITLRSDSTFEYKTGASKIRYKTIGYWKQAGNLIRLTPIDCNNLLHWICTENKLILFENFLIGRTFDKKNEVTEYQYLIKSKP